MQQSQYRVDVPAVPPVIGGTVGPPPLLLELLEELDELVLPLLEELVLPLLDELVLPLLELVPLLLELVEVAPVLPFEEVLEVVPVVPVLSLPPPPPAPSSQPIAPTSIAVSVPSSKQVATCFRLFKLSSGTAKHGARRHAFTSGPRFVAIPFDAVQ